MGTSAAAAAAAASSWQQMRAQAPAVQAASGSGALSRTSSGSSHVMSNAAAAGTSGVRVGAKDEGFWETPSRTTNRAASPLSAAVQQGHQQRGSGTVGGGGKSNAAFGG